MNLVVHHRAYAGFHMTAVIALEKVGINVLTIALIAELLSCDDMETSLKDARSRFGPAALL